MTTRKFTNIVTIFMLATVAQFAQATITEAQEKAQITKLSKKMNASKAAFEKDKKNNKLKASYIKDAMAVADMTLEALYLSPKQKYPASLRLYRAVLKLDSKHKAANEKKNLIEGIYKSMGRPVPK